MLVTFRTTFRLEKLERKQVRNCRSQIPSFRGDARNDGVTVGKLLLFDFLLDVLLNNCSLPLSPQESRKYIFFTSSIFAEKKKHGEISY